MNELSRQRYLTSMGIDSYIPRRLLVQAPAPVLCELPMANSLPVAAPERLQKSGLVSPAPAPANKTIVAQSIQDVLNVMETKPVRAATETPVQEILAKTLETKGTTAVIEPFILTVWRPREDYLIIDAGNKGAALPTHQLLRNILQSFLSKDIAIGDGDRVTFPLVANPQGGNTAEHMRGSIQTWFDAEYGKRPSPNVWLMGENAVQYLLPEGTQYADVLWHTQTFNTGDGSDKAQKFTANIYPSLSDFLLTPALKAKLWEHLQP